MNAAAYDHSRKAGNPGDLFKHAVLAYVASRLTVPHAPFHYVETHAGYPVYRLREGGEWCQGAGRLRGGGDDPALEPYWRHGLSESPPISGAAYPGSSLLVHRVVSGGGGIPTMALWERSPEVVSAMRGHYDRMDGVVVTEGDGYHGAEEVTAAELVLVDPVVLEPEPIVALLGRLSEREVRFLCWVPRRGGEGGVEADGSRRFRMEMSARYGVESARWAPWRDSTCGCQLIIHPALREPAAAAAAAVRRVTGWVP